MPFGERIDSTLSARGSVVDGVRTTFSESPGMRQRFTGKERDEETQLDYFEARYYQPCMARFLSLDPGNADAELARPQSWNAYSYVRNQPMILIDSDGKQSGDPDPSIICDPFAEYDDELCGPDYDPNYPDAGGDSGDTSGGGGPNPLRDNPREKARRIHSGLKVLVDNGSITACEALAHFATAMTAGTHGDLGHFLEEFNEFVPRSATTPPLGDVVGLTGTEQEPLRFDAPSGDGGFLPEFEDGYIPGDDQAHHFAAYFILAASGLVDRSVLEAFVLVAEEVHPGGTWNQPDVALANAAIDIGFALGSGEISMHEVGGQIWEFCK